MDEPSLPAEPTAAPAAAAPAPNAPAPSGEAPLHLDEFIATASHLAEFGPELLGMFRHHALDRGRMTDTARGFRAALAALAHRPTN